MYFKEVRKLMKHIQTVNNLDLHKTQTTTEACGECQASCQTASKVDNTVSNQECECQASCQTAPKVDNTVSDQECECCK